MPKVLCTSLNAENGPHLSLLREAGFDVQIVPRDINLYLEDNLIPQVRDAVGVIAGSEPYTRRVLESAPALRVLSRTGVGFDAIDLAACDEHGIVVATTPGVNHHSVAEHTIAMLMALARGFPGLDRQVRAGKWKREAFPRVMGRTIGLVGLGRIGRAVATRAVGLGMNVVACEPFPNKEFLEQWRVGIVSLDELLARSDFVSLHAPMSAGNRHLVNAGTLAKMKRGSILVNTARGALVDEAALYEALKSGHLGGAGLDVFNVEPLPAHSPLLELENVLFSGHIAGLDQESHFDTFTMAAETIVNLLQGQWPSECVQNLRGVTGWCWERT